MDIGKKVKVVKEPKPLLAPKFEPVKERELVPVRKKK